MNQPRTIERIRETGRGTFALHAETGVFYASYYVFNAPSYNLQIATYDQSHALDGWTTLDQSGIDACTKLFDDCPEWPGECCVMEGDPQ